MSSSFKRWALPEPPPAPENHGENSAQVIGQPTCLVNSHRILNQFGTAYDGSMQYLWWATVRMVVSRYEAASFLDLPSASSCSNSNCWESAFRQPPRLIRGSRSIRIADDGFNQRGRFYFAGSLKGIAVDCRPRCSIHRALGEVLDRSIRVTSQFGGRLSRSSVHAPQPESRRKR